jgi:hypothetical protein
VISFLCSWAMHGHFECFWLGQLVGSNVSHCTSDEWQYCHRLECDMTRYGGWGNLLPGSVASFQKTTVSVFTALEISDLVRLSRGVKFYTASHILSSSHLVLLQQSLTSTGFPFYGEFHKSIRYKV